MGRMVPFSPATALTHPSLLIAPEWQFGQSPLEAQTYKDSLRQCVSTRRLVWAPSPIYDGIPIIPASVPAPDIIGEHLPDLRQLWGSPTQWERSPVMLYQAIAFTISKGWVSQLRAPSGLFLKPGPLETRTMTELETCLGKPRQYHPLEHLPECDHPDSARDCDQIAIELGQAVMMRGALWVPADQYDDLPVAQLLVDRPASVGLSDDAWSVLPHPIWFEDGRLSIAIRLALSRGLHQVLKPSAHGIFLISEDEQKRREALGISDAEYSPLPWGERLESEESNRAIPPRPDLPRGDTGPLPEHGPERGSSPSLLLPIPPSARELLFRDPERKSGRRRPRSPSSEGGAKEDVDDAVPLEEDGMEGSGSQPFLSPAEQAAIMKAAEERAAEGDPRFEQWVSQIQEGKSKVMEQREVQRRLQGLAAKRPLTEDEKREGSASLREEGEIQTAALQLLEEMKATLFSIEEQKARDALEREEEMVVADSEEEDHEGDFEVEEEDEDGEGSEGDRSAPGGARNFETAGPEAAGGAL
jgi:hypothetical protein